MYLAYFSSVVFISFNIQNSTLTFIKRHFTKRRFASTLSTQIAIFGAKEKYLSPFRGLPMHLTGYRYIRLSISAGKPVLWESINGTFSLFSSLKSGIRARVLYVRDINNWIKAERLARGGLVRFGGTVRFNS